MVRPPLSPQVRCSRARNVAANIEQGELNARVQRYILAPALFFSPPPRSHPLSLALTTVAGQASPCDLEAAGLAAGQRHGH